MYLYARDGLRQIPIVPQFRDLTRDGGYAFRPDPSSIEGFGQPNPPTAPIFDVQCPAPAGSPPLAAGQCRPAVRRAIREAIKLANGAANKLDATIKFEPSMRDAQGKNAARLFKFFFGHDPSRPVEHAGNEASGAIVAHRLRRVAQELEGGRRIVFRCDAGCGATTRAHTNQAAEPNVVNLCATFWNPPAADSRGLPAIFLRAGTIIHEMLHVLYPDFFHHAGHPSGDPERRRDNAHCYKAFALRVAGFGGDRVAVAGCTARQV